VHPLNISSGNTVNVDGKLIDIRELQLLKALAPIDVTVDGITTVVRDVQS
jgi:hypothetical protein